MKCRTCNYPLWNIPDRRCPECGTEFLPSQYDFVPRSVRFLCPHCQQQYFGTDERGHLVPRAFNCVKCQQPIDMDQMLLVPAEGITERQTQQDTNPWLDPDSGGRIRRWWKTLGKSMVAPVRLIDSTPEGSTARNALGFALANLMLPGLLGVGFLMLMMFLPASMGRGGAGAAIGFFAVILALWILGPLVFLLLWAAVSHFILAITGPSEGFRRTAHSLWYSSAPYVMCAVPCLGGYLMPVALVWWGVCGTMMLGRAHKAGGFRSALAVFTPIVILLGGGVALVILFVSWASTMAATAQATLAAAQASLQNQRTTAVVTALRNRALVNGAYPAHAIELVGSGGVGIGEMSLSTDPLAADTFTIGTTTLGAFDAAPPQTRQQILTTVTQAQPSNIIAHRLGDYVFTYHGIDPNITDPGLWLFIAEVPDSSTPVGPMPNTSRSYRFSASPSGATASSTTSPPPMPIFIAGTASGRIITIAKPLLSQTLAKQNELRAGLNLPPLPDPTTVTESKPALGPK